MSAPRDCHPLLKPFIPVVAMLGATLGRSYDVALHDVSGEESFIVVCEHGDVAGREEGAPISDFGRQLMDREREGAMAFLANYASEAPDGRPLRSSVALIRDEAGCLIGLFCVNYDMTQATVLRDMAEFLTTVTPLGYGGAEKERFPSLHGDRLGELLSEARRVQGKPLRFLSRPERLELVRWLDGKGFFKLKEAVPRLVKETGKSRYTLYGDIRTIRAEGPDEG